MKIKLQDYSLISNEWIDQRIEELQWMVDNLPEDYKVRHQSQIYGLTILKQQLIPSEKLAVMSWYDGLYEGTHYKTHEISELHKEKFLNSEVELL